MDDIQNYLLDLNYWLNSFDNQPIKFNKESPKYFLHIMSKTW